MSMVAGSWAALFVLLAAPVQTIAQESVESKVRNLEESVQRLERRVASLEAQLVEQSAQAHVPLGKEGWRKLQRGMSESEVDSLLGSATRVDENQNFVVWWYEITGYVRFATGSRKVISWSEP